jgi:hypothetical protein
MGFAVFMTMLVSMCMLRPLEEIEESELYDDVGASLKPLKENHAVKHAMTSIDYNAETLVTAGFAGPGEEYIDLD